MAEIQDVNMLEGFNKNLGVGPDYVSMAADASNYKAKELFPYINKALEAHTFEKPVSLAPGIAHMISNPIYEDDNLAGLGMVDTRQPYVDRNNFVNTATNFMKEQNAEAIRPTTIAQGLAETMQKITGAGKNVAETVSKQAEVDPAQKGRMASAESYGKAGGEYSAQLDFAKMHPSASKPLPAHIAKATGCDTVGELISLFGNKSSDIFGRGLQYLGQVEGAGINAGGNVQAANILAASNVLGQQKSTLEGETKQLRQENAALSTKAMFKTPDGKAAAAQIASNNTRIADLTMQLNNVNKNLTTLTTHAMGRTGATPAPTSEDTTGSRGKPASAAGATSGVAGDNTVVLGTKIPKGTQWRVVKGADGKDKLQYKK
jgi:hypothetical protein